MSSAQTIGFVWPGPPSAGDHEETRQFVPDGVAFHIQGTKRSREADSPAGGITLERLLLLPADSNIEEAGVELVPFGVSAIGYGCTSASYVRGVGGDTDISDRIAAATGLPATTTSSAAVEALRSLGVKRVSVLSPHVDELNVRLRGFLEDSGFEVVHMRGLNKLSGIEHIPQEDIKAARPPACGPPGRRRRLHKLHRHEDLRGPRLDGGVDRQARRLGDAGDGMGDPPQGWNPRRGARRGQPLPPARSGLA